MIKRRQHLDGIGQETAFVWGPRQTGKSTLLRQLFPNAMYFDLLQFDVYDRLLKRPSSMREELLSSELPAKTRIVIDEVQKVPPLLDEVQWLITHKPWPFILCGSSARKLKRGGANLLGGRALRYELYPLAYPEIPHFDLLRALNHGLLPRHYLSDNPAPMWRAYIGDYLKEEIAAEALTRNLPAFSRFLEAAAFSNGEIVNFQNIASECGVSSPTVKTYFEILEDTLLARFLPAFRKRPKRRVIESPKFYFFDVGLANTLLKRGPIVARSESFGKAFEHWLYQDILAHRHYSGLEYDIAYWRTTSGYEVDFILAGGDVAIEIKSTELANESHWKGLKAFREEYPGGRSLVVSNDPVPRRIGDMEILPWREFLERLWAGRILH
jgi:uncharacterized protein